ncbi:MAG: 16S rRNA (cytosine(967)-C(5))-methyltransferase RsmB [Lachnospiraceae bacterium]|nr:16S rRNA (cytosine(967)-C(5))-methyltransferase RsmB [Lachnospiraceae bacterium]
MGGFNTRLIVLDTLMKYEKEGMKLKPLLLDVQGKYDSADRRDKAFMSSLAEGVVERLITLDWITDRVSSLKTGKMKPVIRMILRMGVYQLVFMDHVPDSAAVNESVKLVRLKHMDGLGGFVNGVLRGVIRYRDRGIVYPDAKTEYSVPDWIAEMLRGTYGEEKTLRLMEESVSESPLYLRVNRNRTDTGSLIKLLDEEGIKAEKVSEDDNIYPYTLSVKSGRLIPAESESFNKGMYSVQDFSSQRAIYELWDIAGVYINKKNIVDINVIDLCSAPGGKTCFMAELLSGRSFSITAYDISESKLEKIRQNTDRTGVNGVETKVKDASVYAPELDEKADIIIADLPCSGLGVIGRKVDIKYRVQPSDIAELCKLQRSMIDNAVRYLKPGGILMFSVCTVTKEETSEQSDYIQEYGLHKIAERLNLQGVEAGDGFYYSIWQK